MRKLIFLLLISYSLCDYIQDSLKEGKLPIFIGIGYDLPLGNPAADKVDPGFRASIFDFSYKGGHKTEDEEYLIPDNITSRLKHSCSYSATTSEFTGVHEYQNELRGKVSIGGGYESPVVKAGFSASVEFSKLYETSKKEKNVYISAGATCEKYSLFLPRFATLPLNEDFREGVLLALEDKSIWNEIIEYFGTHYVSSVTMGGRSQLTQKIKEQSYQELKAMGIDVQVAAQFRYAQFTGDVSTEWKSHTKEINSLSSRTDEVKEVYVGGKPPKSGDWKDWQEVIQKHPSPIYYSILSISELLNSKNFRELNQDQLNELKKQFLAATEIYCKSKNCFIPSPDRPLPPGAKAVENMTSQYGGNGGGYFKDIAPTNPILTVKKILIGSNKDYVTNIQLFISDGNTSYYTPSRGGLDGNFDSWEIPQNEYISQIELRSDKYLNSLTFITNKGTKSPTFGGKGGNYNLVNLKGHLVGLFGRSGALIDAIGFISNETIYPVKSNESPSFLKELI